MKLKIFNKDNAEKGTVDLPIQFNEDIRPNLIKRAVLSLQSKARQPYGTDVEAGKKHSVRVSRRRRDYRGSYGQGISRVPRKVTSRRGTRINWVGAQAPGTRGGRRAHPPKADKIWDQKINKKENRKAIRSALSAVMQKELVTERGHKIPENYPFVIDNDFEKISKTKDFKIALEKVGFTADLERADSRKVRAGKGKARSRKYKTKKSLLIVVKDDCELVKYAKNILGVDIVKVKELNAEMLAPGADIGRASLFTKDAIDMIANEKMFM